MPDDGSRRPSFIPDDVRWAFNVARHLIRRRKPLADQYSPDDGYGPESDDVEHSGQVLRGLRIVVVDDSALQRSTLADALRMSGADDLGVAWDLPSLSLAFQAVKPNILLLNIGTRESAALLRAATDIDPRPKVIVLGASEENDALIVACAEAGVVGCHTKRESMVELLNLIRRVAAGEGSFFPSFSTKLLRRVVALASQRRAPARELVLIALEAQILRMLELVLPNHDSAPQLLISVHTMKNHVRNLLRKLGAPIHGDAAEPSRANRIRRD